MISLSALVLTRNEQPNIARTLSALTFVPEVVLLDSNSDDSTVALAASSHPNVRVVSRAFDTHATQWNFGLDQVKTEWVLALDADYEVSPELAREIAALDPSPEHAGFCAEFEYRIYGHRLRASAYPPRIVLFRISQARYVDDGHTQRLELAGSRERGAGSRGAAEPEVSGSSGARDESQIVGTLKGKIYHDDRKPLGRWLEAQERYSKLEAQHLLAKSANELSFPDRIRRKIFFAAPAIFLYLLFGRGLILDGWPGWFYVAQRTVAELVLSVRLLTERQKLKR